MAYQKLSVKERWGIASGTLWGLLLGALFLSGSGDATPIWVTVLLGPPVVFLLLPKRPILSWQIPLVAAAVCGTILMREPDSWSWKNFTGVVLLIWSGTSLLSFPWAAIFWARARHPGETANAKIAATLKYIGVGVLGLLACGLLVLGFSAPFYYSPTDPRDVWTPFLGFLFVTLGIGVGLTANRIAAEPKLKEAVQYVVGLALSFGAFFAVGTVFEFLSPQSNTSQPATPPPAGAGIWYTLAAIETLATLVWLIVMGRRAKKAQPKAA